MLRTIVFLVFIFFAGVPVSVAQVTCVLQPPVIQIDFGNSLQATQDFSISERYSQVENYCPDDGHYSVVASTEDCFRHWITLPEDHTPGDASGNMMLVNASFNPGLFLATPLKNLLPNTTYELSAWLLNVCKPESDCTSLLPNLIFLVESDGVQLARFSTGTLPSNGNSSWIIYSAMFKTPASISNLVLKIIDITEGGCGNDFALDDIALRECKMIIPVVKKNAPKKPVVAKPVIKPIPSVAAPLKKVVQAATDKAKDSPAVRKPFNNEITPVSIPAPISTRSNPVVKQIETLAGELVIDLYDNGEIDGDTVSIYHNNSLIVSRAGLSEKPVSVRIRVDAEHSHHELVMVANNLGSIPPNTSLMIITATNKRYEVFISSSEQKNAKIVIDLKSP